VHYFGLCAEALYISRTCCARLRNRPAAGQSHIAPLRQDSLAGAVARKPPRVIRTLHCLSCALPLLAWSRLLLSASMCRTLRVSCVWLLQLPLLARMRSSTHGILILINFQKCHMRKTRCDVSSECLKSEV